MQISDILTPERIACDAEAGSKKRALELLSALVAEGDPTLSRDGVFDCLLARERLGSTGLGEGVAIPHCRSANVTRAIGAFLRLRTGASFDAPDNKPVDLLFALLVPEVSTDEHLQILSQLAEIFSDASLRARLREASSPETIFAMITGALPTV